MEAFEKKVRLYDVYDYFGIEQKNSFSCIQSHTDNIKNLIDDKRSFASTIEILPSTWKKDGAIGTQTNQTEEIQESFLYGGEFENFDGIITDNPKHLLIMKFADCTPIVIFDKKKKILANIHSGWRGTCKKIFQKALDIFIELNSQAEDLIVFIGPSISKENFEVQQDLIEIFESSYGDISKYITKKDEIHSLFDMKELIKDELLSYNIPSYNIYTTDLCTYSNNLMHSFRRDGEKSGRMYLFAKVN